MKRWKQTALGLSLFFFMTGCSIRLVDFTVISSKNVKVPTKATGQRVTGQDCVFVFIVPFGVPNMKEAIDRAIASAGGDYDALVDGVIYQNNYSFIIGEQCFKIEGTPINTKSSISMKEFEGKELLRHSSRSTEPSNFN